MQAEHKTFELLKLLTDPPRSTIKALLRAATSEDTTHTMSGTIPEVGVIENVPVINLDAETILLIGKTYLAVLELHEEVDNGNRD